jgi:hypothetical protein
MTSVAAYERELRRAQREADIEKVAALEAKLVAAHKQSFARARRAELPPPQGVDPAPLRNLLELEIGIPGLTAQLGSGDDPLLADDPEPVDRYELMREHRRRERSGIPIFRVAERIRAARRADDAAELEAFAEAARRHEAQQQEQRRLHSLWAELQAARGKVAERLPIEVKAEEERRAEEHAGEQAKLDADWAKLQGNDPIVTIPALEQAFADNESPATPVGCDGGRTTVLMRFPPPEAIVPERKPARTPTGKRTLKKRTKTESNALYLEALGSNVLATVKEALAVAPGTDAVWMLVVRREAGAKHAGELEPIYSGEFPRAQYEGASGSRSPRSALISASQVLLNLKGRTEEVSAVDLSDRPDLQRALE